MNMSVLTAGWHTLVKKYKSITSYLVDRSLALKIWWDLWTDSLSNRTVSKYYVPVAMPPKRRASDFPDRLSEEEILEQIAVLQNRLNSVQSVLVARRRMEADDLPPSSDDARVKRIVND